MGRRAATETGSPGRALARTAFHCFGRYLGSALLLVGLIFSQTCRADDPVRGEATFSSAGGFARLVLKLAEDVESEVSTAGSIIIIRFKRPVDIPIDKLSDAVPDYVGSARRDPDGGAIRLSLSRRVTVNTMTAGERASPKEFVETKRFPGWGEGLPLELGRRAAHWRGRLAAG